MKFFGKNKKIKSLIDSGNLLKDPISGKDVIVVEENVIKDMIDKEDLRIIRNINACKYIGDIDECKYKVKIIPFNSLGNSSGMLCGIRPDKVKIYYDDEVFIKDVILGIYFGSLNCSDEYSSIIGLGCIREEII